MAVYEDLALVFGDSITEARFAHIETQVDLARERARPLGGAHDVGVQSEAYVDVPGAIVVRVGIACTAQVQAMASVSGGTGTWRVYDVTADAAVADSEKTFTATVPTLAEGGDLDLTAAHDYKIQVKISAAAEHAIVYGAAFITQ